MSEQNKHDGIIQQALGLYTEGKNIEKQNDEDYSCWADKVYNFSDRNLFNSEFRGNMSQLRRLTIFGRALENNRKNYDEILGALKGVCESVMMIQDSRYERKGIFISHQSKDLDIVESLIKYLKHGIGVRRQDIFCTSKNLGTRTVEPGEKLYDKLQDELSNNTKIFIAVISDNYMQSKICLMELGAAWGLGCDVIPMIVSKNTDIFSEFKDLLAGILMITFTDEKIARNYLNKLKNKVIGMLEIQDCQDFDDYIDSREKLIKLVQNKDDQKELS